MNTTHQENQQDGRLLRRSLDGRILGGVAAGLAALSFLGGAGVPLYLAAWVLIPAEGSGAAIADEV